MLTKRIIIMILLLGLSLPNILTAQKNQDKKKYYKRVLTDFERYSCFIPVKITNSIDTTFIVVPNEQLWISLNMPNSSKYFCGLWKVIKTNTAILIKNDVQYSELIYYKPRSNNLIDSLNKKGESYLTDYYFNLHSSTGYVIKSEYLDRLNHREYLYIIKLMIEFGYFCNEEHHSGLLRCNKNFDALYKMN